MLTTYDSGRVPPENPVWDMETGLSLNVPAQMQLWPGWWNQKPDLYALLQEKRKAAGVVVQDDLGEA